MSRKQNFARRFRVRRALEGSLALGGIFNLTLGILLGLAPNAALNILQLPRPSHEFYLQLLAILAALLGCYYILASSDVRRYSGVIALAVAGRFMVALALVMASAGRPELAGLRALAAVDVLFGSVHAACWWSIRS